MGRGQPSSLGRRLTLIVLVYFGFVFVLAVVVAGWKVFGASSQHSSVDGDGPIGPARFEPSSFSSPILFSVGTAAGRAEQARLQRLLNFGTETVDDDDTAFDCGKEYRAFIHKEARAWQSK
jgi:hypothetical protein